MLKHKAFFDKTTKNITALIFGSINFNEIIFYTTKAQKIFLLTKFSCVKITTVFSRQLISMRLFFILQRHENFFHLPNFSCFKNQITPAFLTSINVNEITSQDEVDTTVWIRTRTSTV